MLEFIVQWPIVEKGETDPEAINRAVVLGAQKLRDLVRNMTPYGKTGDTKRGWLVRRVVGNSVQVYNETDAARWLEHGTKRHPITRHGAFLTESGIYPKGAVPPGRDLFNLPRNKRIWTGRVFRYGPGKEDYKRVGPSNGRPMLHFWVADRSAAGESNEIFKARVEHPGIQARHYLRDARIATQDEIINGVMAAGINKVTGALGVYPGAGGVGSGTFNLRGGNAANVGWFSRLRQK